MKISIEEKRVMAEKGILVNEDSIKAKNVGIYYLSGRLNSIFIGGEFDLETIEKIVVKYPDSKWATFVLKKGIDISHFIFSGNHEKIHEKIMKLIEKLNIVTKLIISEKGNTGHASINTSSHRDVINPEKIHIDYTNNTIKKVKLSDVYREETKKVVTEVLDISNLDKISPDIEKLSLKGRTMKGIDQKLLDLINTLNKPFSLYCDNEMCRYLPKTPDEFLYFDDEIYPLSINMKETYPRITNFIPEEIRKVLDKFSGRNVTIIIKPSTKKWYRKTLPKALALLSKLNLPVPDYLSFDLEVFETRGVTVHGSYESLNVNLNLLFQPEGEVLLPITIIVYENNHKVLLIYKPHKSPELTKRILEALKKFLGTEAIVKYPEGIQNPKNNNASYYLLTYEGYYIITNKELLPTVVYNLAKFAR